MEIIDTFCVEQKIELPPIKPYVTEYHRWQGVCRGCGKKKTAPLPNGVQCDLLGDRAKAVISSLSGFFNNSKRDVQQILENIFNLTISLGLVSATEKRVNKTLASTYKDLVSQMEDSAYLHIDETGHNCRGKRGWGWMFTNRDMSLLKLTSSRGKKVLESMLPEYEGIVISDRYGAYRHFEEKKRQICWSHLKRDFERIAQSRNTLLACQGESLGNISRDVFALDKDFKAGTISRFFYKIRMRKIKKRMLHALKGILMIPDVPHAHRVATQPGFAISTLLNIRKEKRFVTAPASDRFPFTAHGKLWRIAVSIGRLSTNRASVFISELPSMVMLKPKMKFIIFRSSETTPNIGRTTTTRAR